MENKKDIYDRFFEDLEGSIREAMCDGEGVNGILCKVLMVIKTYSAIPHEPIIETPIP